ncbi:MAG: imidazoleglycerol-phosphate dehydratase [candidate division NC10 bacterium RBG_16_65_8]|nr:MAG: imidazoleglycerol-phosphate dehydratase [candidate division NC10 bacterium RBG_16_65_8]
MSRSASIARKTAETDIRIRLDLDGRGEHAIATGIPFLDHMLAQVARHGRFDLTVEAAGDLHVDLHHTVEDLGIALGDALSQALGDKAGIVRYGAARVPMDESLASTVVDLSGRPYLVFQAPQIAGERIGGFDADLVREFFQGLTNHLRANVHVQVEYGGNAHHMVEAVFKALGRALEQATRQDPRAAGAIPSTKGSLA